MNDVTTRGTRFQPIEDTKLAVALITLGVKMPEPVFMRASQRQSGTDGWTFFYDPLQRIPEIESGHGDLTAGDARKAYEDFRYCKLHPEALTSVLRFALESYQRLNKYLRSGNALVHTTTPTGTLNVDGANVYTAEGVLVRQNWGDGDTLTPVRFGRSFYLVRKSQRTTTLKG